MKKIFLFVIFILSVNKISAQWDLSLSMGLDFRSSPSFRDYVNSSGFASGGNILPSFKSSVSFSGEADYKLSSSFALGLEYELMIDSYTASLVSGGVYEIAFSMHRPSILAYYILPGEGYQFKFGGGVGPRFVSLSEKRNTSTNYSASGYGLILKAEGNTLLSKNFYALIGTNLRYDVTGNVTNPQKPPIVNNVTDEKLNLNAFSFGIYLGVTFIL